MKRIISAFFIVFPLLFSCQRQEMNGKTQVQLTVFASSRENNTSKTYLQDNTIYWGENETLRLWYNDGADHFATSTPANAKGQTKTAFNFSISPASASSYKFGGIYPASAAEKDEGSASEYKATLPDTQQCSSGTYDPQAFIMVLKPMAETSVPSSLTAYFRRATALNKITLTGIKEAVNAVEITAPGKDLAGTAIFDLTKGEKTGVSGGSQSVTVNFNSPAPAGTVEFYFTSWETDIQQGEQLCIRVIGEGNTYTRTISASAAGIHFIEGNISSLKVNFSAVEADPITLRSFAEKYVGILESWKNTTGNVSVTDGSTFTGVNIVPADYSFKLGSTTYDKSAMYDVAMQGFEALYAGGGLNGSLPAARKYDWAGNPYNEEKNNGGAFQNATVSLDFLRNYASRAVPYAASHDNTWPNFCNYTDKDGNIVTKGTPQVSGFKGVCCLERSLLIMARFYKHLLDNDIDSNIASTCASIAINASLYDASSESQQSEQKSISILAIGNSFSVDGMQYLYDILKADGAENIVLGNLYIAGCSLETHASNFSGNTAAYTYYKNTSGTWTSTESSKPLTALTERKWDYITLQQVSGNSGQSASYQPYLNKLLSIVKTNCPGAKIYWHMTWAYQANSTHSSFANYSSNQTTMYNAIVSAVKGTILPISDFAGVIPSGTAIQNLRTSEYGDTVTRDGYHLSYDAGRLTAALTWAGILYGTDPLKITWKPSGYTFSETQGDAIRSAAADAIKTPYSVTKSAFTEESFSSLIRSAGYDPSEYTQKSISFTKYAYYNSANATYLSKMYTQSNSTASNLTSFVTTPIFDKSEIPYGSLIVVKPGWVYRPEGWITLSTQNTSSTRPKVVKTAVTLVNDSWWGNWAYRAFNVSKDGNPALSAAEATTATKSFAIFCKKTVSVPEGMNLWGRVVDNNGKGIAGVVVSDGEQCTQTLEDGTYFMKVNASTAKFIYISTPSGYTPPVSNGCPVFYKLLSKQKKTNGIYAVEDFALTPVSNPGRATVFFTADPQPRPSTAGYDNIGYHSLECCEDLYLDLKETKATITDRRVLGVCLGDLVHEKPELFKNYVDGIKTVGYPTYNAIGNHDNNTAAADDDAAAAEFESYFGPRNFSFDVGNVHFVILDNLIMKMKNGKLSGYDQGLTDKIWNWLQADLSYVPKTATISVCAHSPMFKTFNGERSANHKDDYATLLTSFAKVHAWAGHTHVTHNYVYPATHKYAKVEVHTLARSTGELWTNDYLASGTPRGYTIAEIENGEIASWRFHPVKYQRGKYLGSKTPPYTLRDWNYNSSGVAKMKNGGATLSESYQMHVFPPVGTYGDSKVYVNIFLWDTKWGTPVFTINGGSPVEMTRVTDASRHDIADTQIRTFYKTNSTTLSGDSNYSASNTGNPHTLFSVPVSAKSGSGTVSVKDRFGNIYTGTVSW